MTGSMEHRAGWIDGSRQSRSSLVNCLRNRSRPYPRWYDSRLTGGSISLLMSSLCALTISPAEPEKDQLAACRIVTTILEHKMKYKERTALLAAGSVAMRHDLPPSPRRSTERIRATTQLSEY